MDVEQAGALLRELRLERGVSQPQLADAARMDSSVVRRAEKGRDAQLSTWLRLFSGLGYDARFEVEESCEEAVDLLAEETDRRRVNRDEGLCTGKRRF